MTYATNKSNEMNFNYRGTVASENFGVGIGKLILWVSFKNNLCYDLAKIQSLRLSQSQDLLEKDQEKFK